MYGYVKITVKLVDLIYTVTQVLLFCTSKLLIQIDN